MMKFTKAVLLGAAAVAMGSAPMLAQTVTFTTTGSFGGAAGCTASGCTFGNYTLSYIGAPAVNYGSPTLVDLGQFSSACTPPVGTPVNGTNCGTTSVPSGATFTLTVTQTAPTGGTQSFQGSIAGAFTFDPTQSTMKWTPTNNTITIGGVLYTLVLDNSGPFINIVAPSANANPNFTTVKANVVASPEPSTVALMATGIFGLVPLIRRRRK